MSDKPLKTVEEILKAYAGIDDGKLNKRGFVGYNELEQAKADLYQLMLSLLPSQSKYKTVDSYKKAIRQKLSEHFNGEGGE